MELKQREFFKKLSTTPSITGHEELIGEVIRDYAKDFADDIRTDVMENVIIGKNTQAPFRVMLAGHCDQIGLTVQYIDEQGYIYVIDRGGWDIQNLIGQHVIVWAKSGPIPGVIGRKPIHILKPEERKQVPSMSDIWIDVGASKAEEVTSKVRVGDPISLKSTYSELWNDRIACMAADDRTGVWVVLEAMRRADPSKLKCAVYSVATVQEEAGMRGAEAAIYSVNPHIAIAVDVTHATDVPSVDKRQQGDLQVGKGDIIERGPNTSTAVEDLMIETAEKNGIPYQIETHSENTHTDAYVMQVARGGVATGLLSIPNRYMHSPVELFSMEDLDGAADLLARFLESLDENSPLFFQKY